MVRDTAQHLARRQEKWRPKSATGAAWPAVAAAGILLGPLVLMNSAMNSAFAQDVHAVSNGEVQGVRAGITQNVHAGTIAKSLGGEQAGRGGFATSERAGKVITGKAAGYGGRMGVGMPEYASQAPANFRSGNDFPSTDFVDTMPRPVPLDYGSFGGPSAAGFGVSLHAAPVGGGSSIGRSHTVSHGVHHTMKDPDAILNPFTHTIGPSIGTAVPGSGGLTATVLGAGKSH